MGLILEQDGERLSRPPPAKARVDPDRRVLAEAIIGAAVRALAERP